MEETKKKLQIIWLVKWEMVAVLILGLLELVIDSVGELCYNMTKSLRHKLKLVTERGRDRLNEKGLIK